MIGGGSGVMSQGDLCIINTSIDPRTESPRAMSPDGDMLLVTKQTDHTDHYRGLDDSPMYLFTVTRGQLSSRRRYNIFGQIYDETNSFIIWAWRL